MTQKTVAAILWVSCCVLVAFAQKPKTVGAQNIPASTSALLDGVQSQQSRNVIKSVLMILCRKDELKGTGFVVRGGSIITTNSHVVGSCSANELEGISSVSDKPVTFTALERDPNRDLAILCPDRSLPFSLDLNGNDEPPVETEVETWGYPLAYQDPAPILSRGYVAGYTLGRDEQNQLKNPPVKHLIVNGALNPGNSGGPLIDKGTGKVIGIVVEKWRLWSPTIEAIIQHFSQSRAQLMGGLTYTDAKGNSRPVSEEEATGIALQEFYDKSQVMIGDAISVSELNSFIKERQGALGCKVQ